MAFLPASSLLFILASLSVLLNAYPTVEQRASLRRRQNSITQLPTAQNFINRAFHSTQKLGDFIYIDGGEVAFYQSGEQTHLPEGNTYSIDITKDWDNSTVVFNTIQKTAPLLNTVSLWPDRVNHQMYAFGGEQSWGLVDSQSPPVPPTALWMFTPNAEKGTWSEVSSTSGFAGLTRPASAAGASGSRIGLILGGYSSGRTSPGTKDLPFGDFAPLQGIVKFNFTDQSWSNSSTSAFSQNGTSQRANGHVVSGFGDNDIFAFFGGQTSDPTSWHDDGTNMLSFSTIHLYDPYQDMWYNQSTSGTAPAPRDRFCSVGVMGDNGTYEIFVYGGHQQTSDDSSEATERAIAMDQVAVLTIPGFHWLYADYTPTTPRINHACTLTGNRQMIVVGGQNPALPNNGDPTFSKDPWTNGIGVFDLTAMAWQNKYSSSAKAYVTPQTVKDWYGQNGMYPSNWDASAMSGYFQKKSQLISPAS